MAVSAKTRTLLSARRQRCPKKKGHRIEQNRKDVTLAELPTPCFHFKACKGIATLSKGGKSVCRACADKMTGVEYLYEAPRTDAIGRIRGQLNMAALWPRDLM